MGRGMPSLFLTPNSFHWLDYQHFCWRVTCLPLNCAWHCVIIETTEGTSRTSNIFFGEKELKRMWPVVQVLESGIRLSGYEWQAHHLLAMWPRTIDAVDLISLRRDNSSTRCIKLSWKLSEMALYFYLFIFYLCDISNLLSGSYSFMWCKGVSWCWLLFLQSSSSKVHRCCVAYGIFPDQRLSSCPLHWQGDSYPPGKSDIMFLILLYWAYQSTAKCNLRFTLHETMQLIKK